MAMVQGATTLLFERVPKRPVFFLPLMCLAKSIKIVDLSLVERRNCEKELDRFKDYLASKGLLDKSEIIDPFNFADALWEANKTSVDQALAFVRPLRYKEGEAFYLGGFLAHKLQRAFARKLYVTRVADWLKNKGNKVRIVNASWLEKNMFEKKKGYSEAVVEYILFPFLTIGFLLMAAVVLVRSVKFVFKPTGFRGGVCIDMIHGPAYSRKGQITADIMGDTFLAQKEGKYSLPNMSFFCYHSRNSKFEQWYKDLTAAGASLFGPMFGRSVVTWLDFLKLIFESWYKWLKSIVTMKSPISGWHIYGRFLQAVYFLVKMRAKVWFLYNRPSVYINRLDYNTICHPMAASCKELGVHFAGICHSPMGGTGNTPQIGIISFASLICYTPIYWEEILRSWKNGYTHLIPVGVWRSDFAVEAQRQISEQARNSIRCRLGAPFIASLHMPVPGSYLYRTPEAVDTWMQAFEKLLLEREDLSFILLPRRIENFPKYMLDWIDRLEATGRAFLNTRLNPEWKYSYPWICLSDLVIGCNFSDAVNESLACGVPALSYADTGRGYVQIEKYDKRISVYSPNELITAVIDLMDGKWPSKEFWQAIYKELCPPADGKCRERIRIAFGEYIRPKATEP